MTTLSINDRSFHMNYVVYNSLVIYIWSNANIHHNTNNGTRNNISKPISLRKLQISRDFWEVSMCYCKLFNFMELSLQYLTIKLYKKN